MRAKTGELKTYATIQQNSTKENMILIDSKLSKTQNFQNWVRILSSVG